MPAEAGSPAPANPGKLSNYQKNIGNVELNMGESSARALGDLAFGTDPCEQGSNLTIFDTSDQLSHGGMHIHNGILGGEVVVPPCDLLVVPCAAFHELHAPMMGSVPPVSRKVAKADSGNNELVDTTATETVELGCT